MPNPQLQAEFNTVNDIVLLQEELIQRMEAREADRPTLKRMNEMRDYYAGHREKLQRMLESDP